MKILIKRLGTTEYQQTFTAMKTFTEGRTQCTRDEIWITQHTPVFTQGLTGKQEHILLKTDIPIIKTDRGGQATYHGPGQIVMYPLIDIKRANIGVRQMVDAIEHSILKTLHLYDIDAYTDASAPGVYVDGKKIASLGLRVKKGCTYHGLALNFDMDISPFQYINPCGYEGLQMTQVVDYRRNANRDMLEALICDHFIAEIFE